eukprot:GILJ01023017.1.p1 GENE.GILJ01023017.1~~GILJ01023017.1.p1  ORF type:complete len:442 (-),score=66.52 GILJ01023017.1:17-1342(-)
MLSSLAHINSSSATSPMTNGDFDKGLYYSYANDNRAIWLDTLIDSVSPGIFGHRTLKKAMLLSLVGGSERGELSRPAIHLLMVGDPGLGKSQMLRAACLLSARSAFVSANTSSTCGLTVAVSRDGSSGETTFEAGAVVHGDGGITCIDELDKGTNEHKALLEVMEQQSVSIAKAGMIFSMPIQTTVMAAGNPMSGKFDTAKTLCENINMSPALLSRFDIVHVMRDCDSTAAGLTSHILKVHLNTRSDGQPTSVPQKQQGGPLSISELARFLSFAKKEHQPTLSDEASAMLKEAYLVKRREARGQQSDLPITPRYLQSLIRLAEAHAKIHLRPVATVDDAAAAIALHAECSTFDADNGKPLLPTKRMTKGQQQKSNAFDTALSKVREHMQDTDSTTIRHNDLMDICAQCAKSPAALIKQLSDQGALLSSGPSLYRLHKDLAR